MCNLLFKFLNIKFACSVTFLFLLPLRTRQINGEISKIANQIDSLNLPFLSGSIDGFTENCVFNSCLDGASYFIPLQGMEKQGGKQCTHCNDHHIFHGGASPFLPKAPAQKKEHGFLCLSSLSVQDSGNHKH